MATRMMLRTSKNNAPVFQLLHAMKDKTVYKSFPTVAEPSVFCGGFWPRNGHEVEDAFSREMREKGWWGCGLEFSNGKSIGVEVRGRRMVSDEDEEDVGSGEMEDFVIDDIGDDDEDGDFDGDDDDDEEEEKEEEEYVRKSSK